MYLSDLLALAAPLLSLATAEQFAIPEVEKFVAKALAQNPSLHQEYKPLAGKAPDFDPAATKGLKEDDMSTPYWLENINHQGIAAFGPSGYTVFRNVKSYGAVGDGNADDTAAIQAAIADGGRCGEGCASTTTTPAVVYFPAGTYKISSPIFDYYYTMLIGNVNNPPTLKATSGFNNGSGGSIVDSDPYFSADPNWTPTNVFMRQVRNLVFDTTAVAANVGISGIHWPTAQATSLQNVVFNLAAGSGSSHLGLFCESGSAGFLTDLTINGGKTGLAIGNQQFTIRNVVFNNVQTAIAHYWDWGFTYAGLTFNGCGVGIDITSGGSSGNAVGSIVLIDSTISNTPIGIKADFSSSSTPATAGSVILENVVLEKVATAAVLDNGNTALAGGSTTIAAWGQGHSYTPSGPNFFEGSIAPVNRPSSLTSGGKYYTQSKPQYGSLALSSFVSARSSGATGNGHTDDTTALQNAISSAASAGKVLFVDAGTYLVTKTITIPPNSKIVGEAFSVIMSSGSFFNNINSPQPVLLVGTTSGQSGSAQLSDLIIATQGAQAGAVLIQWNLAAPAGSPSGLWDVHTRVGGFVGGRVPGGHSPPRL